MTNLRTFVVALGMLTASVAQADHTMHEYFVPHLGSSRIYADSYGQRYSLQQMYWRGTSLTALTANADTYEHETVFYNYDGMAYASTHTNTWLTNLPDPYLDTQAVDGTNEYNIAIGTFDANTLVAGQWYSYIVNLNSTGSTKSMYKISGQKGVAYCEWSAWCVNNHQAAALIPFKQAFTAPESRDFKYEWESNDSTSSADRLWLGQWGSGVVGSTSDIDYFSFTVPSGRTYPIEFTLKLSGLPAGTDYDLKIYNSSGALVASGFNGGNADEIFTKYLVAGTYYARVYSYAGSNTIKTYHFIAR